MRRALDVAVMRGGTSRGPVLNLSAAPTPGLARDALARSLIGGSPVQGLGGGSATTSKVVLVGRALEGDADLEYIVGNLSPNASTVDWSGTCGNMTAAVVPYAALTGLLAHEAGRDGNRARFRLRNLATQGRVDIAVHDPRSLDSAGADVELTTSYLEPGGAVLGATLPTGKPLDMIEVAGEAFECTIIDVTHPYLLVRYDEVVGDGDIADPAMIERIERVRGTACVLLGLCEDAGQARHTSAAVPRIVLMHTQPEPRIDLRVTAVSMGSPVGSVPATAAMSLAVARLLEGTLVADTGGSPEGGEITVVGPAASIRAWATVDSSGHPASASVDRTARCIMRGTAWA